MPSLTDHHSSSLVKVLYIGDSSTGKTGSLVSLVDAGYKLRVLDMDNGLDPLKQFIQKECPDKLGNVDYITLRDKYKATAAGPIVQQAKAFYTANQRLEKWDDGSDPAGWGADTILVIDSLSALGAAAFEWAKGMAPSAKDPRQWYFAAQQACEHIIALLTSEAFATNLIVISHINFKELQDGSIKGYANVIGSALGPTLPRYFNTLILAESSGFGKNAKKVIRTVSTGVVDLKNPAPFKLEGELPLGSGLATIFEKLKEQAK